MKWFFNGLVNFVVALGAVCIICVWVLMAVLEPCWRMKRDDFNG